jgi:hypothetical protein
LQSEELRKTGTKLVDLLKFSHLMLIIHCFSSYVIYFYLINQRTELDKGLDMEAT